MKWRNGQTDGYRKGSSFQWLTVLTATYHHLHFLTSNGPAPVLLALLLLSIITYVDPSAFKTTVSGSRKCLELRAKTFPASERTCVHWDHSQVAVIQPGTVAYDLCRNTFSPKLRTLALYLRTTGLLCSYKNCNPQIKNTLLNTMMYYFLRD